MFLEPINLMLPGIIFGIGGYFLATRSESKKWFKAGIGMLITAGMLFALRLASDRVYVISEGLNHSEKWHLGFSHVFKFSNGREELIENRKDLMVNNSAKTLNIKSITYFRHSWLSSQETEVELVVAPYSIFYFNKKISWWFTEPPPSITVKMNHNDILKKYYVVVAD